MSFSSPVDNKVLSSLVSSKAKELQVWSQQHSNLFDLRLHSFHTCPFLAYIPAYFSLRKNPVKWANWLYEFYGYKHKEENHCECDQLLK